MKKMVRIKRRKQKNGQEYLLLDDIKPSTLIKDIEHKYKGEYRAFYTPNEIHYVVRKSKKKRR
jgi:uncharacterized protein (DUF2249 family)